MIQSRRYNDQQSDDEQAGRSEGGHGDRQLRRLLSRPRLRRHLHPHQLLLHHPAGEEEPVDLPRSSSGLLSPNRNHVPGLQSVFKDRPVFKVFCFQCGGTLLKILIKDMPESLAILWSRTITITISFADPQKETFLINHNII